MMGTARIYYEIQPECRLTVEIIAESERGSHPSSNNGEWWSTRMTSQAKLRQGENMAAARAVLQAFPGCTFCGYNLI
jgi:hypothetical protein